MKSRKVVTDTSFLGAIFKIKEAIAPALPDFHKRISEVFGNQAFAPGIKLAPLAKVFEQIAPA